MAKKCPDRTGISGVQESLEGSEPPVIQFSRVNNLVQLATTACRLTVMCVCYF